MKKATITAYQNNIPNLFGGSYRKQYDKAMKGHSLRAAINSKCLDCMCWQATEVKKCSIIACPLHPYRPYQTDTSSDSESQLAQDGVDTE